MARVCRFIITARPSSGKATCAGSQEKPMTRLEAKRAFAIRFLQSVAPMLLGLALFYYMWRADSYLNPLTWAMFHHTYAAYSVAGAITVTAIFVTVVGTIIYILNLFFSSSNDARPRPLLFALLVLVVATLFML